MHKLQAAQQTVNAVLALTVRFNRNNNIMKCGSSISDLLILIIFSLTQQTPNGLHHSDRGKGRWRCGARCSYRDLCKSFRVTDIMNNTLCGTQRRDTEGSNPNSYQRTLGFICLYEDQLIPVMVLCIYWVVLDQCHDSFTKHVCTADFLMFPNCFFTDYSVIHS